jgi:glycosyltransferase involved in cell wall biosynthesis
MKPGLSIIMIVKDEAAVIARALTSAVKVADEIIVVDTGSVDNTRGIAASFGARIFNYPWQNHFAVARNRSLAYATHSWVMWIDADDTLPLPSIKKINELKKYAPFAVYSFKLKNIDPVNLSFIGGGVTQGRFFPNDPKIEFRGRIHENIGESAFKAGIPVISTDIEIHHHGYMDKECVQKKLERNISLELMDMGFPSDTKFITFPVRDYNCFYAPNVMTIWRGTKCIGACDPFDSAPFDSSIPTSDSERHAAMFDRAHVIIDEWESHNLFSDAKLQEEINRISLAAAI